MQQLLNRLGSLFKTAANHQLNVLQIGANIAAIKDLMEKYQNGYNAAKQEYKKGDASAPLQIYVTDLCVQ